MGCLSCRLVFISNFKCSNYSFLSFPFFRYKKDHDDALLATCSLHNLLNASLLSESGPPLLDFEVKMLLSFFVAKVPKYLTIIWHNRFLDVMR